MCTISALKARLRLEALIVYIQKPFLRNQSLTDTRYNLYWPFRTNNWKDIQVIIVIRKNILNTIIVENWTDLIRHPYCICLNIKKIDKKTERWLRKTRIIKLYNNKIGQGQLWKGSFLTS